MRFKRKDRSDKMIRIDIRQDSLELFHRTIMSKHYDRLSEVCDALYWIDARKTDGETVNSLIEAVISHLRFIWQLIESESNNKETMFKAFFLEHLKDQE